jgi:small subunit ribosomal protein S16
LVVRIRLRRTGAKGQASYRIVVADVRSPRDGRFLENVGNYNPRTNPASVEINDERVRHWLEHGAQPSDAVARLLEKKGLIAARRLRYNTPKGAEKAEKAAKTEKPAAAGA